MRFLERNFKVFIDGNEVEIEGFRASGSNYELEVRAPSEVGSHSAVVEAGVGLKRDFDSLEILVTTESPAFQGGDGKKLI